MEETEYLVSFGLTGEFGRFHARTPLHLRRGERVVVQGARGVEIGEVMRPAMPGHAHFLPNTSVGQLLRRLTPADEQTVHTMRVRGQQLNDRGQQLAAEMELPLVLLDVEMLLDGEHAVLHYLHAGDVDVRPFVSTLSREFAAQITLIDLSQDREGAISEDRAEQVGCGRPNCGQETDGGCSTCGNGGCGTCASAQPRDVALYFAQLREQMKSQRTALL